jgi:hypothetical protein
MTGGNELNAPNTIDNCQDGNSGNYHSDESIDKIVVRSGDVSGNGAGESMRAGQKATIIATVYGKHCFRWDELNISFLSLLQIHTTSLGHWNQ